MNPQPMTPQNCDLREFPYLPVDIVRLFSSEFHFRSSDAGWRAGFTLWLKSYHQVPAASVPNDDAVLTRLAEFNRDINGWRAVKDEALYGWILCDDGRYYHPVVAEKALEAWISKLTRQKGAAKSNAARWGIIVSLQAIERDLAIAVRLRQQLAYGSNDDHQEIAESSLPDQTAIASGSDNDHTAITDGSQQNRTERNKTEGRVSRACARDDAPAVASSGAQTRRSGRSPKSLVPWPPDFALTAEMREYATRHGFDGTWLFEKFRNKALAKGWEYRDWPAAFRNFAQNEQSFSTTNRSNGTRQDHTWRPPDV